MGAIDSKAEVHECLWLKLLSFVCFREFGRFSISWMIFEVVRGFPTMDDFRDLQYRTVSNGRDQTQHVSC